MRFDRSQYSWLALMGVMAVAFVAGIWWPAHRRCTTLCSEIAAAQQKVDATRSKTEGLTALADQVAAIRAELNQAHKTIPLRDEQADLLRRLSERIRQLALSEASLSTRPTRAAEKYSTLPIQVAFRGDSRAALRFVNEVEAMDRLVRVVSLRMEPADDTGMLVDTEMQLDSYFYAEKETTP